MTSGKIEDLKLGDALKTILKLSFDFHDFIYSNRILFCSITDLKQILLRQNPVFPSELFNIQFRNTGITNKVLQKHFSAFEFNTM